MNRTTLALFALLTCCSPGTNQDVASPPKLVATPLQQPTVEVPNDVPDPVVRKQDDGRTETYRDGTRVVFAKDRRCSSTEVVFDVMVYSPSGALIAHGSPLFALCSNTSVTVYEGKRYGLFAEWSDDGRCGIGAYDDGQRIGLWNYYPVEACRSSKPNMPTVKESGFVLYDAGTPIAPEAMEGWWQKNGKSPDTSELRKMVAVGLPLQALLARRTLDDALAGTHDCVDETYNLAKGRCEADGDEAGCLVLNMANAFCGNLTHETERVTSFIDITPSNRKKGTDYLEKRCSGGLAQACVILADGEKRAIGKLDYGVDAADRSPWAKLWPRFFNSANEACKLGDAKGCKLYEDGVGEITRDCTSDLNAYDKPTLWTSCNAMKKAGIEPSLSLKVAMDELSHGGTQRSTDRAVQSTSARGMAPGGPACGNAYPFMYNGSNFTLYCDRASGRRCFFDGVGGSGAHSQSEMETAAGACCCRVDGWR